MDTVSDFLRGFQASLDSAPMPEEIASVYRPESCLADKPQGSVWLIRRKQDGERFILRTDREQNLREEFDALSRLPESLAGQISEAVSCFEIDGTQYLIRSYLPGRSLAETEVPLPEPQCIRLGAALCRLLDRLHRLSPPIIHRDIKPENIILLPDGTPALIDFGIARSYDPRRDTDTVHMGTRSTAAPEQYGFSQSDQRTDLYSLGVTLRWMLTGSYEPDALEGADCPEKLKRCLNRAAAFDPRDRYPSAGEFGQALDASLKKPRRRRDILAAAAAACLAVLALILCWPRNSTVEFDSALLEQAVRYELDKPEGPITGQDLERVERLAVVGQNLLGREQRYDYTLFGYVDDVPQRDTPHGDISDLSLLAQMPNLKTLYLCQQQIEDLSPLTGLPLEELYLADNLIADLSPLETLSELQVLFLGNNPARDLSPLAPLSHLRELNLDSLNGDVDSFAPLTRLHLWDLHLCNQRPADGDWSPLGALDEVADLWLWHPPAEALEALSDMRSLQTLSIGDLDGENLSLLRAVRLDSLALFNGIPSLEGLEQMENLYYLNLEGMEGVSLEPVAALSNLHFLSLNNCREMDYSPLLHIPSLETVEVWSEDCLQELERDCPEGVRAFQVTGP